MICRGEFILNRSESSCEPEPVIRQSTIKKTVSTKSLSLPNYLKIYLSNLCIEKQTEGACFASNGGWEADLKSVDMKKMEIWPSQRGEITVKELCLVDALLVSSLTFLPGFFSHCCRHQHRRPASQFIWLHNGKNIQMMLLILLWGALGRKMQK